MPKQNAFAPTKKKSVTFAKKISTKQLMEEVATRALAESSLSVVVKKKMKGILKKSSYKNKKIMSKDVTNKQKSVRYVCNQ